MLFVYNCKFMRFKICFLLMALLVPSLLSAQHPASSLADKLDEAKIEGLKDVAAGSGQKGFLKLLLDHYRRKPAVYMTVNPEDADYLKRNFPQEVASTIKVADEVRRHYFLFRYEWDMEKTNIPYHFKGAIDWRAIPFGDPEWCFMLNRHRYWIDLAKAYYLTGDEQYARTWVKQVTDWIAKNPVDDKSLKGLSWRRIEAGIRCENWIKSWELLRNSQAVTPEFFAMFLQSLHQHAEFINSSFSDFSKTSNWGILEHHGLFNVAVFLREFKQSGLWLRDALNKLELCTSVQILPDGVQWEQSPMYHNEVFHCLMNVVLLGQRNDIEIPTLIKQKVHEMAWANVQWQKPNYKQPLIGDSDDSDLRGLLSLATWLYRDGGLKSRAHTTLNYENYFVLGRETDAAYRTISPVQPSFLSVYQPHSGDVFLRDSWSESASYLNFHVRKIGCGHAHDDLLHLALFAHNRDYLVDGGRYSYVESEKRKLLKSSDSHNGLAVDNQPNSIYNNTWGNSFNAKGVDVFTKFTQGYDYAQATNNCYQRLADPVSMTRRVLFLKPGLWLVFDNFVGRGAHRYSQFFGFADKQVTKGDQQVCTTYGTNDLTVEAIKPVEINLNESVWSPEYNLLKENIRAEFSVSTSGSHSFITALYFPEHGTVNIKQIPVYDRGDIKLGDSVAEAVEVVYNSKEYLVLVVNNPQGPVTPFYKVKGVVVTGEVVVLEKQGDGYQECVVF